MNACFPLTLAALALIFASCSTGVVPMGRDTYMISGSQPGLTTSATVRARLLREADKWCRDRNVVMIPLNMGGQDAVYGQQAASAEIQFRAVPPNDPENRRITYERATDYSQVVEIRNR